MNTRAVIGWRELVAVAVGGMLGTGIRVALGLVLPEGDSSFPLGTLLINVAGSFLLGLVVSTVFARSRTPLWLTAGLGTGLLGAFTTFSAIMVSAVALTASGQWMLALGYIVASVVLGLVAALLGLMLGRPSSLSRRSLADVVDE